MTGVRAGGVVGRFGPGRRVSGFCGLRGLRGLRRVSGLRG